MKATNSILKIFVLFALAVSLLACTTSCGEGDTHTEEKCLTWTSYDYGREYDYRCFEVFDIVEVADSEYNIKFTCTYKNDGTPVQYKSLTGDFVFDFDDSGKLISYKYSYSEMNDDSAEKKGIVKYEYENKILSKISSFDTENKLIASVAFKIDKMGRITETLGTSAAGEVFYKYRTDYEYDKDGNCIKMIYYNSNDEVSSYAEIENIKTENGKIEKLTNYDPDGTVTGYHESEYDANGFMFKATRYDENRVVKSMTEYQDTNGNYTSHIYKDGVLFRDTVYRNHSLLKQTSYDSEGNVSDWWDYEYDDLGREIKRSLFNKEGELQSYNVTEYHDNGFKKSSKVYSSEGILLQETIYNEYEKKIKQIIYNIDGSIEKITEYDD